MTTPSYPGHSLRPRSVVAQAALAALIVISILLFVNRVALRGDPGEPRVSDGFSAIYAAGFIWNASLNPYDAQDFAEKYVIIAEGAEDALAPAAFTYPPMVLPLAGALAGVPIPLALFVFTMIQWWFAALTCGMIIAALSSYGRVGLPAVALSVGLLNATYVYDSIDRASPALLTLALLLGVALTLRHREVAAGLLIGAASISPVVVVALVGYALLRRAYVSGVIGILAAAVLNVAPLLLAGLPVFDLLADWLVAAMGIAPLRSPPDALITGTLGHVGQPGSALLVALAAALVVVCGYLIYRGGAQQSDPLSDLALAAATAQLMTVQTSPQMVLLVPAALCFFIWSFRGGARSRIGWSALTLCLLAGLIAPWDLIGGTLPWWGASFVAGTLTAVALAALIGRAIAVDGGLARLWHAHGSTPAQKRRVAG